MGMIEIPFSLVILMAGPHPKLDLTFGKECRVTCLSYGRKLYFATRRAI
jgi:hypothetical protein